eukprot:TRINITY_DN3012_c0_g1_i1.p1 TRINITY_DN3012_c0_g1~~TRINITY_DN3012_c0_g1_i1.p1  ORF type:complete len:171 (+),score=30.99 TRINITY_DN3012_c0_g1_i1:708-1220(+)
MLNYNADERASAAEALLNPWLDITKEDYDHTSIYQQPDTSNAVPEPEDAENSELDTSTDSSEVLDGTENRPGRTGSAGGRVDGFYEGHRDIEHGEILVHQNHVIVDDKPSHCICGEPVEGTKSDGLWECRNCSKIYLSNDHDELPPLEPAPGSDDLPKLEKATRSHSSPR